MVKPLKKRIRWQIQSEVIRLSDMQPTISKQTGKPTLTSTVAKKPASKRAVRPAPEQDVADLDRWLKLRGFKPVLA